MRNAQQYIESLRDGREVYIHGERVDDITMHPSLRKAIDHGALDYELDKRPELRDLLVTKSPETGNEIRRYFEIPRSAEDLLRRQELIGTTTRMDASWVVFMKEIGTDALNALNMICYQIDKKYGTPYSSRVATYRRRLEEDDLSMAGAVTDAKGDRKLRPSEQEMPYYYLKVKERRPGGVVVRGCKLHTTSSPITNELPRSPNEGNGGERQRLLHSLWNTGEYTGREDHIATGEGRSKPLRLSIVLPSHDA